VPATRENQIYVYIVFINLINELNNLIYYLPFDIRTGSFSACKEKRVNGNSQGGGQENEKYSDEDTRKGGAGAGYEVVGQEIDGDDDGDRVEDPKEAGLLLLLRGGGGGRGLAEEEGGDDADDHRDDGEHDEEGGSVVGEERGAEVGEDGGAETHVALEDACDWASVLPEVAYAGHQHRRVHPRRAVPSHAQEYAHLSQ
jgi:hypothetical protein